jgi:hypothetical protein
MICEAPLRAVGGRVWAGADAALPARVSRDGLRALRHLHLVSKGEKKFPKQKKKNCLILKSSLEGWWFFLEL